jgi:RNA polymerase sigma factor (TIGR02999 family)
MSAVTSILSRIEQGDSAAAEQLLPLVYDELRRLAAAKLGQEKPGQTLQATALVHEAYLRLVDSDKLQQWNSRGHFFGAAAEAMRRILVETARRKQSEKHGGRRRRIELSEVRIGMDAPPEIEKGTRLIDFHLLEVSSLAPITSRVEFSGRRKGDATLIFSSERRF